MKNIFFIILAGMLLIACKKDPQKLDGPESQNKQKYPVTFTVEGFSQDVVPFTTNSNKAILGVGDTLVNYASYLQFGIYNQSGALINQVYQNYSQANGTAASFGTISQNLPLGTYNVFFAASRNPIGSTFSNYASDVIKVQNAVNNGLSMGLPELFVKRLQITVVEATPQQQVRLDREVAGFQLVITDAIPTGVARITVTHTAEAANIYANGRATINNQTRILDCLVGSSYIGLKNIKYKDFMANTTTPENIILRALNETGGIIVEKTVPNVRFYKNQVTILSGALFQSSPTSTSGFSVVVDPSWAGSNTVPY